LNNQKLENILTYIIANKYSALFYTPPLYKNTVSYFFKKPKEILTASSIRDCKELLNVLNSEKIKAYTLLNYELGYALEKSLNMYYDDSLNNIQILKFAENEVEELDSKKIDISVKNYGEYKIKNFRLNVTENEYKKTIKNIKKYLIAGDTYQVNYTVKSSFTFSGDYISLFKTLIFNQSARYSAFINLGEKIIISISPELFFEIKGNVITTIPMKGTSKRGMNIENDIKNSSSLKLNEKDRAENVMIIDLLRNDIGRFCEYGSIKANELFSIEKYESLYQMVSKIKGRLNEGTKVADVIKNIFPCGSVTGAPKIKTMEIINELENEKRGIYTGAIGILNNGKATFNVTIRTMEINKKSGNGTMGLGSGIVIDSDEQKEYEEVNLKGKFLNNTQNYFELFETMRIVKGEIIDFDKHINRIKKAADFFLFYFNNFNLEKTINEILSKIKKDDNYRLKLMLNKYGLFNYELSVFNFNKGLVKIILSKHKISSSNTYQYFKTTNRKLYDNESKKYAKQKYFEVIFLNERDELTEGSISNIFIKINNKWFTPKIESGILNGIQREKLLKNNSDIKEETITLDKLLKAEGIILTNSLKGQLKVDEFHFNDGEIIHF